MITAEEWYDTNPDLARYHQGDVIKNVPYFFFPNHRTQAELLKWRLLRPRYLGSLTLDQAMTQMPRDLRSDAARNIADKWTNPRGEYFMSVARKMTVMIATRGCAMDRDSCKHYLAAPVYSVESLPAEEKTEEKLNQLRTLNQFDRFYLPAHAGLPESFADVSEMMPLHWTFFGERPNAEFVSRLKSEGQSKLQEVLADSFGLVFGFSHQDVCTQVVTYACSSCFYKGVETPSRKTPNINEPFGECPNCGQSATWIKLP